MPIRREVLRVARRFAAHNEETGVSYNRFGYDTARWYRERGFRPRRDDPDADGSRSADFPVLRDQA